MISKIMPAIAFIIALLVFFLYVDPTYTGSIAATQAAIASDNQTLAAATQYTAKQNQLISAEKAIDPDALARLAKFLPDSADDVGLILDLDALAARTGLSLTAINVAQPTPGTSAAGAAQSTNGVGGSSAPYGSVDLMLTATGSYNSFRAFLGGVESSARLLDVRNLTVTGSETGVYAYAMTIRLYWLQ